MPTTPPGIAILTCWIAWWASWLLAAIWRDRAAKRPGLRHEIGYRLLGVAGYMLLFGAYRHRLETEVILWRTPDLLAWALVPVVVAGLLFTWWARLHLGRLWSSSVTRKADHRIIDTGPYGIVRHPIYSGITLAAIATAMARGTVLGWLGVALLTTGWVVKARLEETFLREQLGVEAYADYARRVPMLVPFTGRR
jgi:protein-S-isoprenylcysteine O-methyltransferase Ste14